MEKLNKEDLKVKIEYKNELEEIPILTIYSQGNDIKTRVNDLDHKIIDPIKVYGYLKIYLKKLENDIMFGEEDE